MANITVQSNTGVCTGKVVQSNFEFYNENISKYRYKINTFESAIITSNVKNKDQLA